MSPRSRLVLVVAACALTGAGAVVGVTLATRTVPDAQAGARSGTPPLELDLGLRTDAEARALREAEALYRDGRLADAAAIFARWRSAQAQVGLAFAEWPRRSPAREEQLALDSPRSAVVQLHAGLALYWAGRVRDAVAAWQRAASAQPDTPSAVRANDLLHPGFAPGLPPFVPSRPGPAALERLPAQERLAALAGQAARGGAEEKLHYGAALQRLGRPVSALREFDAAARAAPADPEALTAAAVGRFAKADPAAAFSRLGPLARRFPRAQTVRFHLGLMLLWMGQVQEARKQLRSARALGPRTGLGTEAARFLERLDGVGTG